jgi:hypothetical protein
MKIDTKKCTPIQSSTPEVVENPNKYILRTTSRDQEEPSSRNNEEDEAGRGLMFLVNLIFTPTLRSNRVKDQARVGSKENGVKKDQERLVSNDGMDDLCKRLDDALKVSNSGTESESDSEEESEPRKSPKSKEVLGRVDKTVFSYRDCKSHSVRRSARTSNKH